jgi:hypothetical protein
MAGSVDFIRIEIPCPSCGKASLQLLKDAIENDAFVCLGCGHSVDLTTEKCRNFLKQVDDFYRSFPTPPKK